MRKGSFLSKHFNCFLLELAAIVFLVITAPFWIPIALTLAVGGLIVSAIGFVLLLLLGMCSSAQSEVFFLAGDNTYSLIPTLSEIIF